MFRAKRLCTLATALNWSLREAFGLAVCIGGGDCNIYLVAVVAQPARSTRVSSCACACGTDAPFAGHFNGRFDEKL